MSSQLTTETTPCTSPVTDTDTPLPMDEVSEFFCSESPTDVKKNEPSVVFNSRGTIAMSLLKRAVTAAGSDVVKSAVKGAITGAVNGATKGAVSGAVNGAMDVQTNSKSTLKNRVTLAEYWETANILQDIILPSTRLLLMYFIPQMLIWLLVPNMLASLMLIAVAYCIQIAVAQLYARRTYSSFATGQCFLMAFIGGLAIIWNALVPPFGFTPTALPLVCIGLVVVFDTSNRLVSYIQKRREINNHFQ